MIVLDVCVLIAHVDADDAHHDRATQDILDRLRIEVHELPHAWAAAPRVAHPRRPHRCTRHQLRHASVQL